MKKKLLLIVCFMAMSVTTVWFMTMVFSSFRSNVEEKENTDSDMSEQIDGIYERIDSLNKKSLRSAFNGGESNGWNYREEKDQMTDHITKFVSIVSENSEKLDFPYGTTFCKILIRKSKRYGTDVMIIVSSGQIHGSEYNNDNYIMARFDENQPIKYYFAESADGSSEVVFVNKVNDFIQRAKKANKIKIEIPFFEDGRRVFCFSTNEKLKW